MYNQEAITLLSNSIGFGQLSHDVFELDEPNVNGSSGLEFSFFSKNITPNNILDSIEECDLEGDEAEQNVIDTFTKLRSQAAIKTLLDVFDGCVDYDVDTDYSQTIISRLKLLMRPFGLAVAISSLDMMITSKRENLSQRNVRESFTFLKMELNGAKNDNGKTLSYGIDSKYRMAIREAQEVIFPKKPEVNSGESW